MTKNEPDGQKVPADFAKRPYRPGVGVMIVNRQGLIFVGKRRDSDQHAWQMPQGGVEKEETSWQAALREMEEETGIQPHLVTALKQSPTELTYDIPPDLANTLWSGKYRGQRQTWFALRFLGQDSDIDINTANPEFRDWRWVQRSDLIDLVVSFKRDLYKEVLAFFSDVAG